MNDAVAKRGLNVIVVAFVVILLSVSVVYAKEYPSLYRGPRPLAMGGAFTAVADDENALFYNPAGISEISTLRVGIVNPLFEVSKDGLDFINDALDTDLNSEQEAIDFMENYIGAHNHARVAIFPNVGFNVGDYGVMLGALGQVSVDAEVRDPVWPVAEVDFIRDLGLMGGVGAKLPFTGLRAGASLKFIDRESLNETYDPIDFASNDLEDTINDDYKSGSGVSMDLGVIYTLPFVPVVDLDVGLAVLNFPNMDMGDAKDIDTQANLGLAVKKSVAGFGFTGALDYMDLGHNIGEDDDWAKRVHLGAEVKFPMILSLQAGLNQGYLTGGVGISFKVLRFEFATYGEEVGAHAGQREDRRYVAQFTIGW